MAKVSVFIKILVLFMIVKGQKATTMDANHITPAPAATPAPTSTKSSSDSEVITTLAPPIMFQSIMSTLAERLETTMEKPILKVEREKIMEKTRKGLDQCKEKFRLTNRRSRYRYCVDKQVQYALKRARILESGTSATLLDDLLPEEENRQVVSALHAAKKAGDVLGRKKVLQFPGRLEGSS